MKYSSKLLLAAGVLVVLGGCSRKPTLFPGAPFPQMTALTCELRSVHAGALNPTYERGKAEDKLTLTLTNLNTQEGKAQLIGNAGTSSVIFTKSRDQMRFLEETPTGNLTLLNVFAPPEPNKPLPAVHSRHILISPGNIAISQYAGSCTPKF